MLPDADIENRFADHTPVTEAAVVAQRRIRNEGKAFTHLIDTLVPDSRQKSLAVTKIEEAVFWSIAGLGSGADG